MGFEDPIYTEAFSLIDERGMWGEHPDYPVQDWQSQVADDDTRLGYWQWVANEKQFADGGE